MMPKNKAVGNKMSTKDPFHSLLWLTVDAHQSITRGQLPSNWFYVITFSAIPPNNSQPVLKNALSLLAPRKRVFSVFHYLYVNTSVSVWIPLQKVLLHE